MNLVTRVGCSKGLESRSMPVTALLVHIYILFLNYVKGAVRSVSQLVVGGSVAQW